MYLTKGCPSDVTCDPPKPAIFVHFPLIFLHSNLINDAYLST